MTELIWFNPQYPFDDDEMPPEMRGKWHAVVILEGNDPSLVCTSDMFTDVKGVGEDYLNLEHQTDAYQTKQGIKNRQITCKKCVAVIRRFKIFRLLKDKPHDRIQI